MQSLELTSNQIKELQETGRVTVEREIECKVEKCPNHGCDDFGGYAVPARKRRYVTRDMSLDACDLSLEGRLYNDDKFELEQCQFCYEKENSLFNTKQNSPFKVGDVYWVAEEWGERDDLGVLYRDQPNWGPIEYPPIDDHEWQPPSTMPQWGSRFNIECLTSDIKEKDGKWYWVGEFKIKRK